MIDKMTQQQRMILFVVITFLFFIIYESLMPKPKMIDLNQTTNELSSTKVTPINGSKLAPTTSVANKNIDAPIKSSSSKSIATIKSKNFNLTIDDLGRVSTFSVLGEKFRDKEGNYPEIVSAQNSILPLEVRFSDANLNEEAFKTPYSVDKSDLIIDNNPQTITLTQKLSSTTLTKKITFYENGRYDLDISLTNDTPYFVTNGTRPKYGKDLYTFKGALIKKSDGKLETIEDGDAKGDEVFNGASIVASVNKYYSTLFYNLDSGMNLAISKDSSDDPEPFIRGSKDLKIHGYIGPKEYDTLKAIDPRLTDVIEYGFFTFIAKPLFIALKYIHNVVGNWGWAIVIITILLKLILFPLTFKGMASMNRMKALQPKIKALQEKYKNDKQKIGIKTMELYKKEGVNPMGGCFPMLLQIPVFFAIYRVLLNAVELKHAPWIGWIDDLSIKDPYFILPILMGITMYWQQRITPNNFTDPMQEKVMKFLPLIFTFFFVTFPAGLTLYWFVNNLFTVGQQYYINSIFNKDKKVT